MKPGSVLVDIAVDQGGCFEDTHATTHADPTYEVHNSVFYCVANMPGAVPNTSTWALTNATLPYAVRLADQGWLDASRRDPGLALGINTHAGDIVCAPVAEAHGLESREARRGARLSRAPLPSGRLEVMTPTAPDARRATRVDRAVRSWLTHLDVERGVSANTLKAYRRDLGRWTAYLASIGVDDPARVGEPAGERVPRAAARGRRGAPTARREPPQPARSSRSAGCTASSRSRGRSRPTPRPR